MNTLVLRHVPDGLYRRLKAVAAGLQGGLQCSARALRK